MRIASDILISSSEPFHGMGTEAHSVFLFYTSM